MREVGGRIVLMDFGAGEDDVRTAGGRSEIAGTPSYVAPEVFAHLPPSKASDIYSLGVLLFHLVTDRYPIPGSDRQAIQRSHEEGRRIRLRDLRPDLPEGSCRLSSRPCRPILAIGIRLQGSSSTPWRIRGHLSPFPHRYRCPDRQCLAGCWQLSQAPLRTDTDRLCRALPDRTPARRHPTRQGGQTVSQSLPAATVRSRCQAPYTVEAAFYRSSGREQQRPLAFGDRVAPGDKLAMKVRASDAVYVYVVNEDDRGEAYLLYPLPGQQASRSTRGQHDPRVAGGAGRRSHGVADHECWWAGALRGLCESRRGSPFSRACSTPCLDPPEADRC